MAPINSNFPIMAPSAEITIPTTTLVEASKPYTLYNITIRLPLRSFEVQKRYSDFENFNDNLVKQVGAQPPVNLPGKSWFSNTNSNPTLREERRQRLEQYLQVINENPDSRWRNSSVWRAFLNLPSAAFGKQDNKATLLHKAVTDPSTSLVSSSTITDPVLWLDYHREVKQMLHDARLNLTRRDQATTPLKQHEASALAKSSLVKAGSMIVALEDGLKHLNNHFESGSGWSSGVGNLGEGELRRRKDLVANAKKEKDALENLHSAMLTKSKLDQAVAAISDKDALIAGSKAVATTGRVLGKETNKTRALDNQGVLQLQKQIVQDQDLNLEELRKAITRQKELGIAITEELEIQSELLDLADEDVERYVTKFCLRRTLDIWALLTGWEQTTKENGCGKEADWEDFLNLCSCIPRPCHIFV